MEDTPHPEEGPQLQAPLPADNSGLRKLALILGGIAAVGFLASILLPLLARAKGKGNRVKCAANLRRIAQAHSSFADANDGKLSWQLTPQEQQIYFGNNKELAQTVGGVFGLSEMKQHLMSPKILISPCDPKRAAANEMIQEKWASFDTKAGKPVPSDGISYVLCVGADMSRPSTILATTRNLSTDDLATSRWLGAERNPTNPNTMADLNQGQGQMALADGSTSMSNDSDIGSGIGRVKEHINSSGGVTVGPASTRIFR